MASSSRIVVYDDSFQLASCDWVGFDIDHALVRYHIPHLTELVYGLLVDYLVAKKGYPSELRDCPVLQPQKGVLFEHASGNLLKLDADGRVVAAWHGARRRLSEDEIGAAYPTIPWWGFHSLQSHKRHESFTTFLCYFSLPAVPLIANLVDLADRTDPPAYSFVPDVFEAFNAMFDWTHFGAGTGGYFSAVQADPARYVHPRPKLRPWLQRLRERGQRLFVCSNSHLDYASFLMGHILGPDWRDLFDVVIFFAFKPGFFTSIQPFRDVDLVDGKAVTGSLTSELRLGGAAVVGGNAAAVQALADLCKARGPADCRVQLDAAGHVVSPTPQRLKFAAANGATPYAEEHNRERLHIISMSLVDGLDVEGGEHVLTAHSPLSAEAARIAYVGDHLHGDIAAARHLKGWAAVGVVEELESGAPEGPWRVEVIGEPAGGHTADGLAPWGDFFQVDGRPTFYGQLLSDCAAVATSDVAALYGL